MDFNSILNEELEVLCKRGFSNFDKRCYDLAINDFSNIINSSFSVILLPRSASKFYLNRNGAYLKLGRNT